MIEKLRTPGNRRTARCSVPVIPGGRRNEHRIANTEPYQRRNLCETWSLPTHRWGEEYPILAVGIKNVSIWKRNVKPFSVVNDPFFVDFAPAYRYTLWTLFIVAQ